MSIETWTYAIDDCIEFWFSDGWTSLDARVVESVNLTVSLLSTRSSATSRFSESNLGTSRRVSLAYPLLKRWTYLITDKYWKLYKEITTGVFLCPTLYSSYLWNQHKYCHSPSHWRYEGKELGLCLFVHYGSVLPLHQ